MQFLKLQKFDDGILITFTIQMSRTLSTLLTTTIYRKKQKKKLIKVNYTVLIRARYLSLQQVTNEDFLAVIEFLITKTNRSRGNSCFIKN